MWRKERSRLYRLNDNFISTKSELTKCFFKYKTPCFLIIGDGYGKCSKKRLVINPELKKWQFYKLFDSYSAFQEISLFLGNDLARERQGKVPTGDDVTLAVSKGFDKWSFRKMKG